MKNAKKYEKRNDALYEAIVSFTDVQACYDFFVDLCTVAELNSMEQRFEVARLLRQGLSYNKIFEATGASSATISRVNRSLNYGTGSYDKVIGNMSGEQK